MSKFFHSFASECILLLGKNVMNSVTAASAGAGTLELIHGSCSQHQIQSHLEDQPGRRPIPHPQPSTINVT